MAEQQERSRFQSGEVARVPRSHLFGAPYNPRKINAAAAKKLRENLKKVGLLGPAIIFNVTTGHLVSGHQRLAAMDALEKTSEYQLDVTLVEMDEETEKAQVVFLNNEFAQGSWDADLLGPLLTANEGALEAAGLSLLEAQSLLNGTEWGDAIASLDAATPTMMGNIDRMTALAAAGKAGAEEGDDEEEGPDYEERRATMKGKKETFAQTTGANGVREENQVEKYVVCVFATMEQCTEFALLAGGEENAKYVDGETLLKRLRPKPRRVEEVT